MVWVLETINYGIYSAAINARWPPETSCIANGQAEIVAIQNYSKNTRYQSAVSLGTLVSKIIWITGIKL